MITRDWRQAARAGLLGGEKTRRYLLEQEAARALPCLHPRRVNWRCVVCHFDLWPARRLALLAEYGTVQQEGV